ncbi:MAG: hypothetical protein Q7T79_03655 [bacterium]|nr:hypothetical protein [bacterium]
MKKIIKKILIFFCSLIVIMTMAHFALALDLGIQYGEATGLGQEDPRIIAANIIRIFFGFLGIIAVGLIIYAGWLYMTAGGEEDKVEKAKKILMGAVIGIIICLASFAIASFILNKLLDATGAGGGSVNTGGGGGGIGGGGVGAACYVGGTASNCIIASSTCDIIGLVCDATTCKCKSSGLPGVDEACLTDALDTDCSAGICATGLTCNSSDCKCKETNLPSAGQNCDADTGLAGCQATDCSNNLVCSADNSCTCVKTPLIAWISPLDASSTPNGAPGNFITIGGQYFGTSTGQVIFLGDTSTSTDDKIATFPNQVNSQCTNFWQDNQIIVVVPVGATTGPIKVLDSTNLWDTTDNNRGPAINDFTINNIKRPGLCLVNPNVGSFDNLIAFYGVNLNGINEKAFFGNKTNNILANARDWSRVLVPNIQDGRTSVFATVISGNTNSAGSTLPAEDSNSLGFTVKNNIQDNPFIDYLTPIEGPKGRYITIYGRNFKNFDSGKSVVKFYLPTDPNTKINAGVDFPIQCQGKYWNDTYITIKVPQVAPPGDYKVIVINENSSTSTPANFKITTGSPSPGLCLLDPYNGPVGQSINAYGEYFGASQGANGRAVFYNNASSSPTSWADQAIKTNVPSGAQTGPFKIINNQVGNALPFKVGACVANTDCLNSSTEECCPSGTYNAGICKTEGECSLGGPQSCTFGWTFSTALGTSTPLTCGGYSAASACSAVGMCPNARGECQSRTNIETGYCSDNKCNEIASSSCASQCAYDKVLNKCKLLGKVCDVKDTTLVAGFTAECRKVGAKNIWQINTKDASCPNGASSPINGWCSVGDLGFPIECVSSSCPAGLTCQSGQCVISSSGCSNGSFCGIGGKCIKGYGVGREDSVCECCCRVANSAQDCCAGLTCKAGGCGVGAPDYGLCTGCKVIINGQVNQSLSDQTCNCTGKTTRYCDLTDLANPSGVCKDQAVAGQNCYVGGVAGACTASSTCASSLSCNRATCKCETINNQCASNQTVCSSSCCTQGESCDVNGNSGRGKCGDTLCQGATCGGNCCVGATSCASGACPSVAGAACYVGGGVGACNIASSTCASNLSCNTTNCTCESSISFPQFGQTCAKKATTTVTCDIGVCTGFSCLNATSSSPLAPSSLVSCGTCCCDPTLSATNDQCKIVNPKLSCLKNKGNCSGSGRGLCCGCVRDDECGNSSTAGCSNDTCCSARPRVNALTTPTNNETGVCRNTVIEATFDQIMDITSFNNNMFLIGDYGADLCPTGTKFLGENISKKSNNIFTRAIKRILISLGKILKPILSEKVLAAINSAHTYCLINGAIGGYNGVASTTVITFALQKALDAEREYSVIIQGDASTTDSVKEGVLGISGVSMKGTSTETINAKTFTNSKIWSFTTSKNICQIDSVIIDPISYLFQTSENNPADDDSATSTYDTINDSDKVYRAKALALDGQEILPINNVYSWNWDWTIDNKEIVDFKNLNNTNQQTLVAQNKKDGKTVVYAKAIITDDKVIKPSTVNKFKIGKANVYVLMCANPWPPINNSNTWLPWRDTSGNCSAGLSGTDCFNNNFEFYYCRDAGQVGTADDLPAILKDTTVIRGNYGDPNPLKEYYFLREDVPSITVLSVYDQRNSGKVVAVWEAVNGASGYKLYYGKDKGQYDNSVDVNNVVPDVNNKISSPVIGLINNQTYYFAVSAYYKSTGAESIYSNEVSIIPTDTSAPSVPTGLIASSTNQKVELTWIKGSDDVNYYRAFYGTARGVYGAESVKVSLADSCSATMCKLIFENLVNNTNYYFAIKAFDEYNNGSVVSVEVSAMTQ